MRTEKVMKESVPETTTEFMTAETDTRGESMIGLMILTDTETMTDNLETGEVTIDKSMREEMRGGTMIEEMIEETMIGEMKEETTTEEMIDEVMIEMKEKETPEEEMSIAESRRKPRSLTKLLMKLQGRERKVSRGRPQMVEEEQMVSGTPSGRGCSWMRS